MSKEYEIEVINWKKYNPKVADRNSTYPWFSFYHKFLTDVTFFEFTSEEELVWVKLLCYCAQTKSEKILVSTLTLSSIFRLDQSCIVSALRKLKRKHMITFNLRKSRASKAQQSCATTTEQNRTTTEQNKDMSSDDDAGKRFLSLWNNAVKKLPTVRNMNERRIKLLEKAKKDIPLPEDWVRLINYLENDPFSTGTNDRKWVADMDYVLQEGKALNILEKSENKKQNKTGYIIINE